MELKFKDVTATVISIYQWRTYEDLLEGVPNKRMNKSILERTPSEATRHTYIPNYFMLEAKQTPIEMRSKFSFGKPMRLPGIVCVLGLKVYRTSSPEISGHSELTLISFQDKFNPPFEDEFLEQVEKVEWFSHSMDISFDDY